ncbi:4227_t:CDS:2, partial [Ambispora gerdemannii]
MDKALPHTEDFTELAHRRSHLWIKLCTHLTAKNYKSIKMQNVGIEREGRRVERAGIVISGTDETIFQKSETSESTKIKIAWRNPKTIPKPFYKINSATRKVLEPSEAQGLRDSWNSVSELFVYSINSLVSPARSHSHLHALTHTRTLSLTPARSHSHSHALTHTRTLSLTPARSHSHPHALTHTRTLSHSHAHSLSHALTHSHSFTLSIQTRLHII